MSARCGKCGGNAYVVDKQKTQVKLECLDCRVTWKVDPCGMRFERLTRASRRIKQRLTDLGTESLNRNPSTSFGIFTIPAA